MRFAPVYSMDALGIARFGSSPSGNTTTTTNSSPWAGQQGYLIGNTNVTSASTGNGGDVVGTGANTGGLFGNAQALYQSYTPQYYPGQTVAQLNDQETSALDATSQLANQGGTPTLQAGAGSTAAIANGAQTNLAQPDYNQSQGYLSNMLSGAGGVNQAQTPATAANGYLSDMISGTPQLNQAQGNAYTSNNYLSNMLNNGLNQTQGQFDTASNTVGGLSSGALLGSAAPTAAQGNAGLSSVLSAGLDPASNPYLSSAAASTLAQVMPSIQGQFAGGDRLDSGLATEAASAGATQALGNLNYGQYNTNVGNVLNAAGQSNNALSTALSGTLGATGQAATNEQAQEGLQSSASSAAQQALLGQQGLQSTASSTALSNLAQQQALQQGAANLSSTNYQDAAGNTVKADAIAPSYDAQTLNDLQAGYNAGDINQSQNQANINAAVQQYNYNENLPYNMLGMYDNFINGSYGGSTTTTQPYFSNSTANILSGVSGAGSLASGLGALIALSDRRAKTDIERIAETDEGLPIYSFRYRGSPRTEIGLMAQDVEKRNPDAVVTLPSGYKAVNYAAALGDDDGGMAGLIDGSARRRTGRMADLIGA